MMHKVALVTAIFTFAMAVLFSQVPGVDENPAAIDPQQEEQAEGTSDELTNSSRLASFAPTFPYLKATDAGIDERDFEMLKKLLDQIEHDYLLRILDKAERIVYAQTNDEIAYYDVNGNKIPHPRQEQKDYQMAQRVEFASQQNFYDLIKNKLAYSEHVRTGLKRVTDAYDVYERIKLSIQTSTMSNEIPMVEYRLYLYHALFNLYSASRGGLQNAAADFEYLLENDLAKGDEEKILYNTYLAGINMELAKYADANQVMKRHYLNNMFDSLWDIIVLKNKNNEEQKNNKIKHLITTYHKIVNPARPRFKEMYEPYFLDMGLSYSFVEEEKIEEAGAETTTSENTSSPASDPVPATVPPMGQ